MRTMVCAVILVCGCGNSMRAQARVGLAERETSAKAAGAVEQTRGRDVFNVSPTLAVSGGGGVVLLAGLMLAMSLVRSRRTVRAMVSAIEGMDETIGKDVKREIARAALGAGVGDYLHGVVRKKSSQ